MASRDAQEGTRRDRARDGGRRAAGAPRHADPEKARARERKRSRERTAERVARGLCRTCGREPPVPGRRECATCAEVRRARQRERYREARAFGKRYGGRDPETCREVARRARRKRSEAGLCRACGARPPADGAILCEPCLTTRRAADRAAYAARRAAGICIGCGTEAADGAARCARCATRQAAGVSREKKNAAKRRRYVRMRVQSFRNGAFPVKHDLQHMAVRARFLVTSLGAGAGLHAPGQDSGSPGGHPSSGLGLLDLNVVRF